MTTDILFIFVLTAIIIILLVERYLIVNQHNKEKDKLLDELSKMSKAVISKNANDYVMAAAIDKVPKEEPQKLSSDLVDEETLSDKEFMQTIGKGLEEENKEE